MDDYARHPDWLGLLRGVCEDPADDLPRLVAADWLDENGDGDRAEFIRLQVEQALLADQSPDCPEWQAIQDRIRPLLGDAPPGEYRPKLWEWFLRDLPQAGWQGPRIRRGFAESVEVRLDEFVGGACGSCGGRGHHGSLRNETGGPVAPWRMCYPCSGTGRTPGVAAALFASQPITNVTLSDREPFDAPGSPASYDWALERAGNPALSLASPHVLPEELFRRLPTPDADWGGGHAAYFGSGRRARRSRANVALSAAAVAHGREAAGLTALPVAVPA